MPLPGRDWSDEAVVHEALVAPRRAIVPMPDTVVEERPGWFSILTPSSKQGGLNEIVSSTIDGDVDALIDETLARYRSHGVRFRWTLLPDATPIDLRDRLARRGLEETISRVMWRTTDDAGSSSSIAVDYIREDLDELTRVLETGWSVTPGSLAALHRAYAEHPARRHRFFLARRNGEPAGAAGYVALDRSAYFVAGVVLPEHRGAGVYAALVRARLAHARESGLALATSVAKESTSAPILAHLGFRSVGTVSTFTYPREHP